MRVVRFVALLVFVAVLPCSEIAQASLTGVVKDTMAGIDLYNALNSSAILTYNNSFVPNGTWLQPVTILTGRLIKFSAEITF